jgi:actin-related protein
MWQVLRTALVSANDQTGIRTSSSRTPAVDNSRWPVDRGQIVDWEAIEDFWHYLLYNQLGWEEGNEGQVLYSEPLFTSKASRERLAQVSWSRMLG